MTTQIPEFKRQNEIDLLRVIAAFSVFFFHYTDTFNYFFNIVPGNIFIGKYFRYGYMGVMLFFVISGYVVTMSTMNKTLSQFVFSRVTRLYPVFWLSCFIALILPRIFPHIHTYIPYPNLKATIVNLTMIPSAFNTVMINPVFWSLLEEIHFYLIISAIILFRLWDKVLVVIICWLIIYAVVIAMGYSRPDEKIGILVPKHSLYFIAGMLFYLVRTGLYTKWKLIVLLLTIFALTIPLSFLFAKYSNILYKKEDAVSMYGYILINILIFSTFWLIANKKMSITSNRPIALLGDLTYPFYLIHLYGLGLYWYLRDKVQSQVLLLFIFTILLLGSLLINRYFEKPLLKFFRRYRREPSHKVNLIQVDNKPSEN